MRFIDSKVHGILDYLYAIVIIASPWLLHFSNGGAETYIPVTGGIAVIIYSLLTDYELGVFKRIKMASHLIIDFIAGIFLAVSPWLFHFNDQVYLPHVAFGVVSIAVALCSKQLSYTPHSV